MNANSKIEALIFDMDGVLIDSEPLHYIALQNYLLQFSVNFTEEENSLYLGQKDIEIAVLLIEKYGIPRIREEIVEGKEEIFRQLIVQNAVPRAGVVELLEEAKQIGLKIAIASSATLPSIKLIVNSLKLNQFFHCIASGDEVKQGKPAPDVFLLAAERIGVSPNQCLVIEDTEAGVEAARIAGMKVVAVPCDATKHQRHRLADMRLNSLCELNLSDWVLK